MTVGSKVTKMVWDFLHTDEQEGEIFNYCHGDDMTVVSTRINAGQVAILDIVAADLRTSRSALLAEILEEAIPEAVDAAIAAFSEAFQDEEWDNRTYQAWRKAVGLGPGYRERPRTDGQIDIEEQLKGGE